MAAAYESLPTCFMSSCADLYRIPYSVGCWGVLSSSLIWVFCDVFFLLLLSSALLLLYFFAGVYSILFCSVNV